MCNCKQTNQTNKNNAHIKENLIGNLIAAGVLFLLATMFRSVFSRKKKNERSFWKKDNDSDGFHFGGGSSGGAGATGSW